MWKRSKPRATIRFQEWRDVKGNPLLREENKKVRTWEPAESLETKRQGTRSWTRPRLTAVRFLGDPTLVSADVIPRGSSSLSFSLSRTAYQGSGNLKFTKREKTYSCCIILITFPWAAAGFPLVSRISVFDFRCCQFLIGLMFAAAVWKRHGNLSLG